MFFVANCSKSILVDVKVATNSNGVKCYKETRASSFYVRMKRFNHKTLEMFLLNTSQV